MRIVQLANFYGPNSGGLRTAVDTLGRGYQQAGHDRVLVVPGQRRQVRETDAGTVITLPGAPVSGGYRMMLRPAAVCRELDLLAPDSIEVSDKATLLTVSTWARANDAQAVLFSHERLDTWLAARLPTLWRYGGAVLDPAVRRWNCGLARRFDTVVVTSAFAEHEFAELGVGTIRRIPLGVDLATFRPVPRPPRPGPVRLAYAGRLSPEKNPQGAIGAVRQLVRDGLDVRLDVYGNGVAEAALRRQAAGLPVVFHGFLGDRAELAARLADADIAFAPSAAETFGLSVLEALACGTPVVAADTGAAPELLAPGAGVAVPATPDGLAGGVAEVLNWPTMERRVAARRRAEQFPWSATTEAMLDLHSAAAGGGSRRLDPPAA
ncbi:MAG TPA: glycosyltransferase [Pseudonocardiaceae bacterium]|jgi:alpha-1,6-mannosyltransferase|nr:glycosyltransferase [Pseudonocardiaceae bacterium]